MGLVDFTVGDDGAEKTPPAAPKAQEKKRFLGMKFECANNVYTRFYVNDEGNAYIGRCPACLRQVRIRIGMGGTSARFFTYNCQR